MLWHRSFDEVPPGPAIIIANEFLDALPVHQAIKNLNGWYERTVEIDRNAAMLPRSASPTSRSRFLFEQLLPPQV